MLTTCTYRQVIEGSQATIEYSPDVPHYPHTAPSSASDKDLIRAWLIAKQQIPQWKSLNLILNKYILF